MKPTRYVMNGWRKINWMRALEVSVLILTIVILLGIIPPIQIGQGDFVFNWTASYLLARSQNIYDPVLVLNVQRDLIGIHSTTPFVTLSPPWVALMLIPLTVTSFERAAWVWLVMNVIMAVVSAFVLWRITATNRFGRKHVWVGIIATFAFSMTLTAIVAGQTTVIVLAMSVAFLLFEEKRWDEWAGVACAGMLIKPQMISFALLLIALQVLHTRRWRVVLGFAAAAVLVGGTLFLIRVTWLTEYWNALTTFKTLEWESSNLGGWLLVLTRWVPVKFASLVVIPFVLWFWAQYRKQVRVRTLVDAGVLLSVIFAPYGFSYDQIILVIPLFSVLLWIVEGRLSRIGSAFILTVLVIADVISYQVRVQGLSEVYFFWIPIVAALLYVYSAWRVGRGRLLMEPAV